jgi:C4-dicarboxylate-specific signal transduction histidine kinase
VGLSGNVACFNEKFASMWNIPEEKLRPGLNADLIEYSATLVKNPEEFLARVKELASDPEMEAFDTIELKDGRVFERIVRPQRLGNKCVGCVLSFSDVTERKKAEADLETIHQELLQASRQAGMAEVATNVLHNVGNVLNSVNTSASVVMEQVRGSKVTGVSRMAALLEENRDDLLGFLARDNRAQQILVYLKTLSTHLGDEHKTILRELGELSKNIEHIKEIVTMQQSYAKVSGVEELHSAESLIEDSLRIHMTALGRHHVKLIRKYEPVPELLVDKHKVLQILVNLIGNAKYALNESDHEDRQLSLSVKANGGDRVFISVADNGIGIAPENLIRIFSHGFTTKKNGHGFGLHSGFLAAKEMGGSLSVHSDGPGKGATFTLELPINSRSKS